MVAKNVENNNAQETDSVDLIATNSRLAVHREQSVQGALTHEACGEDGRPGER